MIDNIEAILKQAEEMKKNGFNEEADAIISLCEKLASSHINKFLSNVLKKDLTSISL